MYNPSAAKAAPPLTQGRLKKEVPLVQRGMSAQLTGGLSSSQPFRHGCAVPPPLTQGRLWFV